ncbi:alpha-hydroxy acid oxidase [soil metagenome]
MSDQLLSRLDPCHYPMLARLVLPGPVSAWIDSGTAPPADEVAAFAQRRLLPRVLVDVREVDLGTHLLGEAVAAPFGVAPVAAQRVLPPNGEVATARAAARAGVVAILPVNATTSVTEVAAAAPDAHLWLQLYNWADRDALASVVADAERAGVRALVPLVNTPVAVAHVAPSAGFRLPEGLTFAHGAAGQDLDAGMDPAYLRWLADLTSLPVVAKGVLHPDDARRAVDAGARAILVSGHGGRQLPRSMAPLDALEGVVRGVGSDAEVYLDGGVRNGSDVLIALALGARAVFLGRLVCWGLAVGGEEGVFRVLEALRAELASNAALCGLADLHAVPRDLEARGRPA